MVKKKLTLYIETSVPNYLFAKDVPRERKITKKFFRKIKEGKYKVLTSNAVVEEIERTPNLKKRHNLLKVISGIPTFSVSDRAREIAEIYIAIGIIPVRYRPDALHIAIATLNKVDILVTWNMDHLANPITRIKVREENEKLGLKIIEIATPEEVMASEQNIG